MAEEFGRIRPTTHSERFSATLIPFIKDSIEAGNTVHTDGCYGYLPLRTSAYQHRISNQKRHLERASELLRTRPSDLSTTEALAVGNA